MVRGIPFIEPETYAELYLYSPYSRMSCYYITSTDIKRVNISSVSNRAEISIEKNYTKYRGQEDKIEEIPPIEIEETVPNCSASDQDPRPRFFYTLRKFKEFLEEVKPLQVVEIHLPWEDDLQTGKIDLVSMAKEVFGEGSLGSTQFLRIHTFSLQQPFVPYLLDNFDYKCIHVEPEGPLTITEKMMNCEFLSIRATLTNPEILNEFTGTGLMIRNGDQNGYSSDFIMDIIKKWQQHENPITEYVYIGRTHWTSASMAFYEENKLEEREYNTGSAPNKEAIFVRDDGIKCMVHSILMSSKDHIELWFEPFDDEALSKIGGLIKPYS